MSRDNGFGILTHSRSKAEMPFNEWAADLPPKIRKDFPGCIRRAHQIGMSASTTLIMIRRVKHIAIPGCEKVPGSNAPPERDSSPKDTKALIDRLTPDQRDFLTTKLLEMGYA